MIIKQPFKDIFPIHHQLEKPVFYSASHFSLSSVFMFLTTVPLYILLTGYYGYKILILLALSLGIGLITELAGIRITKKYTGYFGLMSWSLFPLISPPGMPLWITMICIVLATIICIVFFGGYGRQIFHPVVVAQVFIMINFITSFNSSFTKPFFDFQFGFHQFASSQLTQDTTYALLKLGNFIPGIELFFGPNVGYYSDVFPYLVLISGVIYILFGGVNRLTPIAFLASLTLFSYLGNLFFPQAIYGVPQTLFGGSALFYAFYIFSDRWSSPKSMLGRILGGCIAAGLTVLMRGFSIYKEAIMFAALFHYSFGPLYDELGFSMRNARAWRNRVGKVTAHEKVEK